MWTRADLKEKAKVSFKRNYWKSVLVALLMLVLIGGGAAAGFSTRGDDALTDFSNGFSDGFNSVSADKYTYHQTYDIDSWEDLQEGLTGEFEFEEWDDTGISYGEEPPVDAYFTNATAGIVAWVIFGIVFLILFAIGAAIGIVLDVFIFNPFEVGSRRFFVKNLDSKAEVKEIGYGFDHNYKNIAKTMFFRDLYTFLWALLLVIPGIVKKYEYKMIPYLLAENPQMTKEQAFAMSRQMMSGQKWRAFVLDLSFIGWQILNVLTGGILGIFYVNPYYHAAQAALYDALKQSFSPENATIADGNDI